MFLNMVSNVGNAGAGKTSVVRRHIDERVLA
jgi:GTPase SAR1 family protein